MSLLYWWPLTTNLKGNLGQNLSVYTGTATQQTVGVVKKNNYYFNGSTLFNYSLNSTETAELLENDAITAAFWLKLDSSQPGWGQVFTIGQAGTSWTNIRFGLDNQLNSKLCFSISDGSSAVQNTYTSNANLQDDKWHHIVAIYQSKELRLYVDGVLQGSGKTTTYKPVFPTSGSYIHIGGNMNGERSKSCIQDVRIYNHAISLKEIEDLANPCVINYDFKDETMSATTNQNPNSSWSAYESYFKIRSKTDTGLIVYRPTSSTNTTLALSNSTLRGLMKTGETWTMTCYLYANGKPVKSTSGMSTYSAFPTTKYEARDDGYFRVTTTIANTTDAWIIHAPIFGSIPVNVDCELRYLQFEKASEPSPYTSGSRTAKIMDSSGYGNHSTSTENIISSSTRSTNADNCLQLSSTYIQSDFATPAMSYTMWYKCGSFPSGNFVLFADGVNKLAFGRYSSYICLSCGGTAARTVPVSAITNWKTGWNHIAITKDSSSVYKCYINGVETTYNTSQDHWTHDYSSLTVGARHSGSYSMYATGYLRDFKGYAKTLTADQIKHLAQSEIRFLNNHEVQAGNILENISNKAELMNDRIFRKSTGNGVSSYTQADCQVTMTDKGLRIYRPANVKPQTSGGTNSMWGGMKLCFLDLGRITSTSYTNTTTNASATYNKSDFFEKGKRYRISFHVSGYTNNAISSIGFTNNMGWGGGGLDPSPSDVIYKMVPTNFGISSSTAVGDEMDCFYEFTINDDVYKTCTTAYSSFVKGNIYPSYRDFQFGFGYTETGANGTELYITNIQCTEIPTTEKSDTGTLTKTITPVDGGTLIVKGTLIDRIYPSTNIEVAPEGIIGTTFTEDSGHLGSTIIEGKARAKSSYAENLKIGSNSTKILSGAIKDNKTSTDIVTADQFIAYLNSL